MKISSSTAMSPYKGHRFPQEIRTSVLRDRSITAFDLHGMLTAGDRAMLGVETRDLLADVHSVEFCLALPEEQYVRDGDGHRLIRQAMVERLPEVEH